MFPGVVLSTKASIFASVYSGPKRLFVGHFFLRPAKMFSARFIAAAFLDHISYSGYFELIACVRRANENAGNLIYVVQFLINAFGSGNYSVSRFLLDIMCVEKSVFQPVT